MVDVSVASTEIIRDNLHIHEVCAAKHEIEDATSVEIVRIRYPE